MATASPPSPPSPTEEAAPRPSGHRRAAAVLAMATVCLFPYARDQVLANRPGAFASRHGNILSEDSVAAYETEGRQRTPFSEDAPASEPGDRSIPSQRYQSKRRHQRWCAFEELSDPKVMQWVPVDDNERQGEETHVLRPVNAPCSLRFTRDEEVAAARKCLAGRSIVFIGDSVTRLVRYRCQMSWCCHSIPDPALHTFRTRVSSTKRSILLARLPVQIPVPEPGALPGIGQVGGQPPASDLGARMGPGCHDGG
jgi:hypothetical protein